MKKLIFVYNVNSGKLNAAISSLHKISSPSTYNCSLCAITHSAIGEKKEWKEFLLQCPFETEFIHKDEFRLRFQHLHEQELPAVFLDDSQNGMKSIMNPQKLESLSLSEFITELKLIH